MVIAIIRGGTVPFEPFLEPDRGADRSSGFRRAKKFGERVVVEGGGRRGGDEPCRDLVEGACGGGLLAKSAEN